MSPTTNTTATSAPAENESHESTSHILPAILSENHHRCINWSAFCWAARTGRTRYNSWPRDGDSGQNTSRCLVNVRLAASVEVLRFSNAEDKNSRRLALCMPKLVVSYLPSRLHHTPIAQVHALV